jgi:hypothetical protein
MSTTQHFGGVLISVFLGVFFAFSCVSAVKKPMSNEKARPSRAPWLR